MSTINTNAKKLVVENSGRFQLRNGLLAQIAKIIPLVDMMALDNTMT
jgi:hypothetical protein